MKKNNRELQWRYKKGCFTDSLAYVLNVHPYRIPMFVMPENQWPKDFYKWLKKKKMSAKWVWTNKVPKKGTYLVGGRSLKFKRNDHCVVYKNGKLVFDCQYPSKWTDKRVQYYLLLKNNG